MHAILEHLNTCFTEMYGSSPAAVTRAPGRLEILGNHTDYNEGVVLSAAVDRATFFAVRRTDSETCRVYDARDQVSESFPVSVPDQTKPGSWVRYIAGIVMELHKRGVEVPAFDAVIFSTIPMSAGMSSSAALEMSTAYALGQIAELDYPWIEWAKIGQACENLVVGARTGLLDQFSSLMGKRDQFVFSDFRDLTVSNVPLPAGTALVVANSMVKHNLTGEYNERRSRCEEALAILQKRYDNVQALRDITRAQLEESREALPVIAYRRALHVVGENERVFGGAAALEAGELVQFGRLLFESHESSRLNFENSCPELDTLVEIGKSLPGSLGARLSGGGFGGITVHLVEQPQAEQYARRLETAYRSLTGHDCETMICQAADGAEVIMPRQGKTEDGMTEGGM